MTAGWRGSLLARHAAGDESNARRARNTEEKTGEAPRHPTPP
ncbi:hypothetical protein DP44_5595 [Burkholderia pseudomallei]|nr:hypothetical protein DP44_5595 [Burkholderia pseudomallei]